MEVHGRAAEVERVLASLLRVHDFGVVAEVRLPRDTGMILRLCYPRSLCLDVVERPLQTPAVRCNVFLEKRGELQTRVEIRKPVRLLDAGDWQVAALSQETDERLRDVLNALGREFPTERPTFGTL